MLNRVQLSLLALSFFVVSNAAAQLIVNNPTVSNVKIASSPDYASEVLGDAWDMSEGTDIATFIPEADIGAGLSSVAVANDMLNFTIDTIDNGYFHMLSPGQCSTNALGKNGQAFPIDSTKYRYLTFRMYASQAYEMSVLWYTGCSYLTDWVNTVSVSTLQGWHTYTIDLATIGHSNNSGGDVAWTAHPVTGLRINPGAGGTVSIDWVRLTGTPPAGSSTSLSYSFTPTGNFTRHSMFLDDDSNPYNGYVAQKVSDASSASSIDVASDYLGPASYKLVGIASDDFATVRADPWDMENSRDVAQSVTLTSPTFASGSFSGTAPANGDSYFFLNLFGGTINPAVYRYLCFQITANTVGSTFVAWYDSNGTPSLGFYSMVSGTNSLDLQSISTSGAAWTSNSWSKLRISIPAGTSANNFSIAWVALRQNGCSSSDVAPTPVVSPGSLVVNSPPTMNILQPDNRGGADFASTVLGNPWNFEGVDDVQSYVNLSTAEIYPNNYVDGLQGNFFHATNREGSGDPYHPFLQEVPTATLRLDTTRFKNLVYRLNIAREQDVSNGSVVRVIWQAAADGDTSAFNGDDQITHDGWNEYIQDMTNIELEPLLHPDGSHVDPPWHGNVNYFRIDAHEFETATDFYFDYVRITADDETDSQFAITYELDDADDDSDDVTVDFYYSTSPTLSNGQVIVQNLLMSRNSKVYLWDTSSLAAGTYYVYAVASDGYNDLTRAATGRLVKSSLPQDSTDPYLVLSEPTAGRTIYTSMVVSGYALDNIQTANVEVFADGALLHSFRPSRYNKLAQNSYPSLAEAGNAGFFERIDTSWMSIGAHTIEVKVYDTAGNITSGGSIAVTRAAGTDPDPISDPSAENESPVAIEGEIATLTLAVKLNASKNSATLRVTGGGSCSQIDIVASDKKSNLSGSVISGTTLKSYGARQSISLSASKLKSLKKKKATAGKSTDIPIYIAALCNGLRTSTVKKVQPVSLTSAKKLATPAKWIAHFATKLK